MKYYFWFLRSVEDDVVSLGMKGLCFCVTLSVLLWLASFVMIMIQIFNMDNYFEINFSLFIPMWMGTSLLFLSTLYISTNVCRNATLVTRERRAYMRFSGTENDMEFMDYDSLQLVKRLFTLSVVGCISSIIILISQILFYLWFIGNIQSLWSAFNPIMVLLLLYLTYMYLIQLFSMQTCVTFTLIFIQMVLYTDIANDKWQWCSFFMFLPVLGVIVSFTVWSFPITTNILRGKFKLTVLQWMCHCAYIVSLVLGILAIILMVNNKISASYQIASLVSYEQLVPILWMVAIVLITCSGLVVLNIEGWRLSVNRGYTEPLPLVLNGDGWTVSVEKSFVDTVLLGRVTTVITTLPKLIEHKIGLITEVQRFGPDVEANHTTLDVEPNVAYQSYQNGPVLSSSFEVFS